MGQKRRRRRTSAYARRIRKLRSLSKCLKKGPVVPSKAIVTNVSTSSSQEFAVDETQCDGNCSGCPWVLHVSGYCLNWGKRVNPTGSHYVTFTRKPIETGNIVVTSSEAIPFLEMLAWSRGLGLRVLWNISCRKALTRPRDVAEWTRHHLRRSEFSRKLRPVDRSITFELRGARASIADKLIESLGILGLITNTWHKTEETVIEKHKRGAGKKRHIVEVETKRSVFDPYIFPQIKTLEIIFNKDPSAGLVSMLTHDQIYEWLRRLTSDFKPLAPDMLRGQKENAKMVFPCTVSLEKVEDEENWQRDEVTDALINLADLNYHLAKTYQRDAIRLWKESGSLSGEGKSDSRKKALLALTHAINLYGQDPMSCPFWHAKAAKWKGIILSREGKWEDAKREFEAGLMHSRMYIPSEDQWFEAAVKETEGWMRLKNALVSGSSGESVSNAVTDFENAANLYERSKDTVSQSFLKYWIEWFKSFGKDIIPDYALLSRIDEYTQRDSPRAKVRRTIIDRQATFKVLTPLLTYCVFAQMAQTLETGLNDIFKKYTNQPKSWPLESLVILSRQIVEPSPSIEWLVVNNTKRKHNTETKVKQEQHIKEIAADCGQMEKMQDKINDYLRIVEQKLKEPSKTQ